MRTVVPIRRRSVRHFPVRYRSILLEAPADDVIPLFRKVPASCDRMMWALANDTANPAARIGYGADFRLGF
jgi:hypothetical protein